MVNKELCINLQKHDNQWRMDGKNFMKFMSHVSGYFAVNNFPESFDCNNIQSADLAADDLYIVSAIFGAYCPNEDTMILAPVNPGSFILPWQNYFQMNVCEKEEEEIKTCSILLKAV